MAYKFGILRRIAFDMARQIPTDASTVGRLELIFFLVLTPSHCTIPRAPQFFDWDRPRPDLVELNDNHLERVSGPLVVRHDRATYLHRIHKAMELRFVCRAWGMALIPIVLYDLWFVHPSQARSFLQIWAPPDLLTHICTSLAD